MIRYLTSASITFLAAQAAIAADTGATEVSTPVAPTLQIKVDPRVELLSLIFRLAGNPEYNMAKVPTYVADVEKQFRPFADHAAVKLARKLRQSRGVSYDAVMGMAVHLTDAFDPQLAVPLAPWPDGLDQRWTAADVTRFLGEARQFVKDSGFKEFVEQHKTLHDATASRMKTLMETEGHLEWFQEYFGERQNVSFTLVPGLLNGGGCYGPHFRAGTGKEELFCILGVWATDKEGMPVFSKDMVSTVVHEFCHSYANPIMDRHGAELADAAKMLYEPVADRMRSQAYGNAQTMLRESLVRASVVRYLNHFGGAEAAKKEIRRQTSLGFQWIPQMSELLAEYEGNRKQYPTLEAFSPRLVAFFRNYASTFVKEQEVLEAKRPKVVSIVPANNATNVDPGLTAIQVVFDRPMRGDSWSMCGGGPNFPELMGEPNYDATRTSWTTKVKLKPNWQYEFRLNAGEFQAFQSEDGVPLSSVLVRFKTAAKKP